MYRVFWALALTGATVATAGWWFGWDFSNTFDIYKSFQDIRERDFSADLGGIEGIPREAGNTIKGAINEAVIKQRDTALSGVDQVASSLTDSFKQQATALVSSLRESVGALEEKLEAAPEVVENESGESSEKPLEARPFGMTIVIRSGVPAFFLIKNNNETSISYEVDWGDNEKAIGTLEKNSERVVEHAWDDADNYIIKFSDRNFLIRVIN